jgi:hypothetical protein
VDHLGKYLFHASSALISDWEPNIKTEGEFTNPTQATHYFAQNGTRVIPVTDLFFSLARPNSTSQAGVRHAIEKCQERHLHEWKFLPLVSADA